MAYFELERAVVFTGIRNEALVSGDQAQVWVCEGTQQGLEVEHCGAHDSFFNGYSMDEAGQTDGIRVGG